MDRPLPHHIHRSRPWRIHALTRDFRLEDVWALPTPGGREDFAALVALLLEPDRARSTSRVNRTLFALRWKLGELFGWDEPTDVSLRERLPADLRECRGPDAGPFRSLYLLDDEWA